MTAEEVIKDCKINGNNVTLPDVTLDRKTYMEVAKKLELIGGRWKGGKIKAFVFPSDPTELLTSVQGGEKRNLKKEFQFFATPDALADELVQLANVAPLQRFLEPSAGQGAIVKAIQRRLPGAGAFYCETMPTNQLFMKKIMDTEMLAEDFLTLDESEKFDRIIANPPFSKNQDIEHVRKMFKHLAPGGRLVSITSSHWEYCNNKKETAFREWLEEKGAKILDIPAGSFKDSGTLVGGKILVIDN